MQLYDIDNDKILDTNIIEIKLYYNSNYIGTITNVEKVSIFKQDKIYIALNNVSIIATSIKIVKII